MRTKQDININKCENCGKIAKEGELTNVDGEAFCNSCTMEVENEQ